MSDLMSQKERQANLDELSELLKKADAGDESAMPVIRQFLLQSPNVADALGGNLAEQVELTLVQAAAGKKLVFKESLSRKMQVMRDELAGPSPTFLERLLAERIVLCWLWLHDLEIRFAQAQSLSIPQAEYRQRAIDRAHHRYLTAIKTLATVRKMAVPALQVNIAKKQVNVAG